MSADIVGLLLEARRIGVILERRADGHLRIAAPPGTHTLGAELRLHEAAVLPYADTYSGRSNGIDWRNATVGDPAPCRLCGRPALIRDPHIHRPVHKACLEDALRPQTPAPAHAPEGHTS
jgi:hypothetical protein